jgi:hypothetical protein
MFRFSLKNTSNYPSLTTPKGIVIFSMRVSSIFLATAITSFTSGSALPNHDSSVLARATNPDKFHVSDVSMTGNSGSGKAGYSFTVWGTGEHPKRRFPKTQCDFFAKRPTSPNFQLVEVRDKQCDPDLPLRFSFFKFEQNGEYAGWKLEVTNEYFLKKDDQGT